MMRKNVSGILLVLFDNDGCDDDDDDDDYDDDDDDDGDDDDDNDGDDGDYLYDGLEKPASAAVPLPIVPELRF